MDKLDQWITREDIPFCDDAPRREAEYAVIQASRKLYDADLVCRRVGRGVDYMAMRRAERAKEKAVEQWREAMRALRETDPD